MIIPGLWVLLSVMGGGGAVQPVANDNANLLPPFLLYYEMAHSGAYLTANYSIILFVDKFMESIKGTLVEMSRFALPVR